MYETFSSTAAQPRFRALFLCDQLISNIRLSNMISELFVRMFPRCDKQVTRNPVSILFGGTQLLHYSPKATFNPMDILDSVIVHVRSKDTKNAAKNLRNLFKKLALTGDGPVLAHDSLVHHCVPELGRKYGFLDSSNSTIERSKIPYFSTVSRKGDQYVIPWVNDCREAKVNNQEAPNIDTPRKLISNGTIPSSNPSSRFTTSNKETLLSKCLLASEFFNGTRHLTNDERRILLTNLFQRRNGLAWYREGLKSRSDYHDDGRLIYNVKTYGMKPEGCKNCPYESHCDHKTNLLQQLELTRNAVRAVAAPSERHSVAETQDRLRSALTEALSAPGSNVHVIRCDCGVGKTEALLEQELTGCCVAFPTHRLKEEAYNRYAIKNPSNIFLWPQRPPLPQRLEQKLFKLDKLRLGGTRQVFEAALKDREVKENIQWHNKIQDYLAALDRIHAQPQLFTTHEKALQMSNPGIHTVIFDEDPINSLLRFTEIHLDDVGRVMDALCAQNSTVKTVLHKTFSRMAGVRMDAVTKPKKLAYSMEILHRILYAQAAELASPVAALLNCAAYVRTRPNGHGRESLFAIERMPLLPDRKYIILSATANEQFALKIFGRRLRYTDLGPTENMGRLYLHTGHSYSKSSIYRDIPGFAKTVIEDQQQYGFEGVITHKFLDDGGSLAGSGGRIPVLGCFGGLSGIDALGGRRIAVYGTPHLPPHYYSLLFSALNLAGARQPLSFALRPVRVGEFECSLMTCSERGELASLQAGLIAAELAQAVGRARLVRYAAAEVHVFAAVPVAGGELV